MNIIFICRYRHNAYVIFLCPGATLSVILGLSTTLSIIISAAVTVGYTLVGGLFSVAFTDAIQLAVLLIGLVNILV